MSCFFFFLGGGGGECPTSIVLTISREESCTHTHRGINSMLLANHNQCVLCFVGGGGGGGGFMSY